MTVTLTNQDLADLWKLTINRDEADRWFREHGVIPPRPPRPLKVTKNPRQNRLDEMLSALPKPQVQRGKMRL